MNKLIKSLKNYEDKSFIRLIGITIVIFSLMTILRGSSFLTSRNIISMSFQFPEMGIIALAISLIFITGGMDLSLVGIANLSSISAGLILIKFENNNGNEFLAIIVAIIVAMIIGLICGYFNGLLVSRFKINPILATLGTMELFTGIALVMTKGSAIVGFPDGFSVFGQGSILHIPVPLILFAIFTFILNYILKKTKFGVSCFLIGSNVKAAKYSGISINKILKKAYCLSGVLASIAGLIMISRVNSARADFGSSYTMQTILIAVLGGIDPSGGKGKISGVVIAVLALQFLSSGLGILRISLFAKEFIWGLLLVSLIAIDMITSKRKS